MNESNEMFIEAIQAFPHSINSMKSTVNTTRFPQN